MKKLVLAAFVCVLFLSAAPTLAEPPVWQISCQGTESGGGGLRQYYYEVMNSTAIQQNMVSLTIATDDITLANYTNILNQPGWNFSIGGGGYWRNAGIKTPHGQVAPSGGGTPTADSLGSFIFSGPAVQVAPGATVVFGFDNPYSSENVDWVAQMGGPIGADWKAIVPGPGQFSYGPVHAPVPEPTTLLLLGFGGLLLRRHRH